MDKQREESASKHRTQHQCDNLHALISGLLIAAILLCTMMNNVKNKTECRNHSLTQLDTNVCRQYVVKASDA